MSILEIILTSLGLGADAFAISICKGIAIKEKSFKKSFLIGFYFAFSHMLFPLLGYFLGIKFTEIITSYDHWLITIILTILGINMLKSAFMDVKDDINSQINLKTMLPICIATSIDSFAVGIGFSFLKINILLSIVILGFVVFLLSIAGVKIGKIFGNKYEKLSKAIGGLILIGIGIKVLCEHLSIF